MTTSERFETIADRVSTAAGRPVTWLVCCGLIVVWAASGPLLHFSDTWQLVVNTTTTIITFLMVFLIQSTQNRDTKAMQTKLDELLRAIKDARPEYIGVEQRSEKEVDDRKRKVKAGCDPADGPDRSRPDDAPVVPSSR